MNINIEQLYAVLKDEIALDHDVEAIYWLLKAEWKQNQDLALTNWLYILNKYPIKELQNDIDFNLMLCDFPMFIIEKIGLEEFLKIRNTLNKDNKYLIDKNLFNSFKDHGIIEIIMKKIINQESAAEDNLLNTIEKNLEIFPKVIFDYAELLKKVIEKHLEIEPINWDYLLNLASRPKNLKDQAYLKALLIKEMNK